jgi:K+-sensing histidine kinase KdpD
MAIVRAVAEAHHTTVTATADPDSGLTVTIAFPDTERPRKVALPEWDPRRTDRRHRSEGRST